MAAIETGTPAQRQRATANETGREWSFAGALRMPVHGFTPTGTKQARNACKHRTRPHICASGWLIARRIQ